MGLTNLLLVLNKPKPQPRVWWVMRGLEGQKKCRDVFRKYPVREYSYHKLL